MISVLARAPIFAFAILASAVRGDGARFADESTAFLRGARSSGSLIADEATTFLRGARSSGSLIADEEAPLVLPPRLAGRRHSRRNGVCGWQQRDSRRATKLLVFTCLVGTVCWWNVASRPLPPPSEAAAFGDVLATAARRALGGGLSGAAAGVIQVLTLMWLRTGMHYQYRHGVSTRHALRTLYSAGGIPRLYQGLPFALMQSPLVRFGDTAAQSGMLSLLASSRLTLSERTACASAVASCWWLAATLLDCSATRRRQVRDMPRRRLAVTPLDCVKTTLQVEGSAGWAQLRQKVRARGIGVLYDGAIAEMGNCLLGQWSAR